MDSFSQVEQSLHALLSDADYKVIALTGKWGTGKTHLWRSLSSSPAIQSQKPIYVSAFGTKSAGDLKLRILQNAYLKDAKGTQQALTTAGGLAHGWLKKVIGIDLENAAVAWLPKLVEKRLITIDDIERKHKSFDIDELLGFVDEYTETHSARIVMLMNSDNFGDDDKDLLRRLHEKVIDAEVVLDPTPSEALGLLKLNNDSPHIAHACEAVRALSLNNIRIIRRVLKTIEQVEKAVDIGDVPTERWVPSTVLLTSSHYKANDTLPPFDYLKSYNTFSRVVQGQEPTDPRHTDWNAILEKLGIVAADEFDVILQAFLDTGFLDQRRLKILFDSYRQHARTATISSRVGQLIRAMWWEPHRDANELLAIARELLAEVDLMSPSDVTSLAAALAEFGAPELEEELVERWVATADGRVEYREVGEGDFEDAIQPLNPKVHAKLREIRDRQHPPLNLREVLERIRKNSGWGERERIGMRSATVDDYVQALSVLGGSELRWFLAEHLGWVRHGPPDESFKTGVDNFIEAGRRIRAAQPESRLTKLLEDSFRSNGVLPKLAGQPTT